MNNLNTVMADISAKIKKFNNFLDSIEEIFGDSATLKLLEFASPYVALDAVAALTGNSVEVLLEGIETNVTDWESYLSEEKA